MLMVIYLSSRCTGARQIVTGLNELHRRKGKAWRSISFNRSIFDAMTQVLVTSMCIGTGMGAAAVFVRE